MPYFIAVFAALIQTILFLAHWFLYKTLVRFIGLSNPTTVLVLRWSLIILSLMFVPASLLAFRYYNIFSRIFYALAAGWLGIFYFLFLSAILMRLGLLLPVEHKLVAGILLVIGLGGGIYGLVNANQLRITNVTVNLPNLPPSWKGKTAVWISDLHLGQIRNSGLVKKLAAEITALRPDAVFIGGDLFDGVTVDAEKAIKPFSGFKLPRGAYFVTGNHEEFGESPKHLDAIKNAGIKILNNEAVNLDGLQVAGVDYRDSSDVSRYEKILEGLNMDPSRPSILLKHEPSNLAVAEQMGVSLQISGHTHRAQVWPFSYITRARYEGYDYGLKAFGKMLVYTSSGAGTWGPPIRFLTIPEIVLIRFE